MYLIDDAMPGPMRGSTKDERRILNGDSKDSGEFVQSSLLKVWFNLKESTYKVKDNVGIALCMGARMSEIFSDVLMTSNRFLTF